MTGLVAIAVEQEKPLYPEEVYGLAGRMPCAPARPPANVHMPSRLTLLLALRASVPMA